MNNHLTIGQFNDSFPPSIDGVANAVINYADCLNQAQRACYAIVPYFPNSCDGDFTFPILRFASVPVPFRPNYRFFHPGLTFQLSSRLTHIGFDILHAHSPFTSGRIALQLAKKQNIPIVSTFHTKYRDDIMAYIRNDSIADKMIENIVEFYNQCDAVWVVNQATGRTLEGYGYKKEYRIVPNGCDFAIEKCTKEIRDGVNQRYDIGANQRMILYVGQHVFQKNTRLIIQSASELKRWGIDFKMMFVGDGCHKRQLEEMVSHLGLQNDVIFTGIVADRHLVNCLYKRADLFLFPSLYDNAPLVVREAAACHTPSLLIEHSNAAEGIINNCNGFLVSRPCPYEISRRIYEIFKDELTLRKVGQKASETICIPWETVLRDVQEQYRNIINDYAYAHRSAI